MKAYSILAKKYDRLMSDFDYDSYYGFISEFLKGKKKGADMACGSGELTVRLALSGKNVVGIDTSKDMLNRAREKARAKALNIPFLQQDMQRFELTGKVEFVTVCCDGVNYIKDVREFFNRVYDSLKNDGVFVFDISTEYKLKNIIGNNIFYEDYNDFTYLWTNKVNSDNIEMDITVFNKENDGRYSREDEHHRQYIHNTEETGRILEDAGFSVICRDGTDYNDIRHDSIRALFVAIKKNKE